MYCQKCGVKLTDGALFCGSCGAQQGSAPAEKFKQGVMHSKEEFLTVSPEFNKEKAFLEAKYKKKIALGYVTLGIGGVIMFICIFLMFSPAMLFAFIMFLLGMFVMLGGGIYAAISTSARGKKLEELRDAHYRNYINGFNIR